MGHTAESAADGIQGALKLVKGRWKLLILFRLFGGNVLRFSELEHGIVGVSQKMLAQQLRELERDGLVRRRAHDQVPPKVEYSLTDWGQSLCPSLDALLRWIEGRATSASAARRPSDKAREASEATGAT